MEELYYVILSNCIEIDECKDLSKWNEYPGTWMVKAKTFKRAEDLLRMNKNCFVTVKIVDQNFNLVI